MGPGLALLVVTGSCDAPGDGPPGGPELSLVETLAGDDTVGYARADRPRTFDFPRDHGPHPDYRTEWWYLTGNLSTATGAESADSGRDFGFQLTIFRSAVAPRTPQVSSRWGTNQVYMGHFTLTDVGGGRFHAHERFARGAVGLAGARSEPLAVWLEDWRIDGAGDDTFPLRISARGDEVSLNLSLDPAKPRVLQGREGLSQKGPEPGNASYYYAYTRLRAEGAVSVGDEAFGVAGTAWLDREWSTSALSEGQVGWDWFALQLQDGWDLMIYRLRRRDGSADPLSDGVLVDPEGARVPLVWGEDVLVEETATWASPADGARYPSAWRIRIPQRGWALDVTPVLDDQELRLSFRYWEGAVRVEGSGEGGDPVMGRGYVELTGYAGPDLER